MMPATDIVLHVARELRRRAVPYMLVGSFSSNFYGRPRQTMDADFVIGLATISVANFCAQLGPEFRLDPQMAFESVTVSARWVVSHAQSGFEVELFTLTDDPHDQRRFSRRKEELIDNHPIMLPTVEDVIITKLRWHKRAARAKDREDVREVLAAQAPVIDAAYVRHWCAEHGTLETFELLLAQALETGT